MTNRSTFNRHGFFHFFEGFARHFHSNDKTNDVTPRLSELFFTRFFFFIKSVRGLDRV